MFYNITCKMSGKLEFPREKRKRLLGVVTKEKRKSSNLPTNDEIRAVVVEAKSDAVQLLLKL